MLGKNTVKIVGIASMFFLVSSLLFGQEYMQVATNMPGFKPTMSYQGFGNGENVNGFSGGLTVTHSSSIALPQNLGGSLGFTRVYNSKSIEDFFINSPADSHVRHGFVGAGWTLSMGRVFLRVVTADQDNNYRKQWFYQDESGAEHRLFLEVTNLTDPLNGLEEYDPSSSDPNKNNVYPKVNRWYFTNDSSYIRARFVAGSSDAAMGQWTLYFPDGSIKILGSFTPEQSEPESNAFVVPILNSNTYNYQVKNKYVNGWYTTRIIDRAGNTIKLYYYAYSPNSSNDVYSGQPYAGSVKLVKDQFGRSVIFTLTSGNSDNKLNNLLQDITFPDGSKDRFYYLPRQPAPNSTLIFPFLIKAQDPGTLETLYDYKPFYSSLNPNIFLGYLLYRIDYPTGATSLYNYKDFSYEYLPCRKPYGCEKEPFEFCGIYEHTTFTSREDGTIDDNISVWRWQRDNVEAVFEGELSTQVSLIPVVVTDPLGRKTCHYYAGEFNYNYDTNPGLSLVPPGTEVATVNYLPNSTPDPNNPLVNAVFLKKIKFSSNGGDADKCRVEYFEGSYYCPIGNIRTRETYQAELNGSGSTLWYKKSTNEVWDGYGHYAYSYSEGTNISGKVVEARQYDLILGENGNPYQLDRLLYSFGGTATNINFSTFANVPQGAVAYPGDPQEPGSIITFSGNFKISEMTYKDSAPFTYSGLLESKYQIRTPENEMFITIDRDGLRKLDSVISGKRSYN